MSLRPKKQPTYPLPNNRARILSVLSLIGLIAVLSACSFFEPHKIAVQQGNLVTAKSLDQLEIGMNKEQVSYLLGTPLSVDPLDPDYWIYSYIVRRDTDVLSSHHVKLRFENDSLTSIESEGIGSSEKAPTKQSS